MSAKVLLLCHAHTHEKSFLQCNRRTAYLLEYNVIEIIFIIEASYWFPLVDRDASPSKILYFHLMLNCLYPSIFFYLVYISDIASHLVRSHAQSAYCFNVLRHCSTHRTTKSSSRVNVPPGGCRKLPHISCTPFVVTHVYSNDFCWCPP